MDALPNEMLEEILSNIKCINELKKISLVSKRFESIVKNIMDFKIKNNFTTLKPFNFFSDVHGYYLIDLKHYDHIYITDNDIKYIDRLKYVKRVSITYESDVQNLELKKQLRAKVGRALKNVIELTLDFSTTKESILNEIRGSTKLKFLKCITIENPRRFFMPNLDVFFFKTKDVTTIQNDVIYLKLSKNSPYTCVRIKHNTIKVDEKYSLYGGTMNISLTFKFGDEVIAKMDITVYTNKSGINLDAIYTGNKCKDLINFINKNLNPMFPLNSFLIKYKGDMINSSS
jgi:hypothetical protein